MKFIVDIETDGLLDTITKIHCLCYQEENGNSSGSITDYEEMRKFLSQDGLVIIGHNFVKFDKPSLEKILCQKFYFKVIDTLPLSWVLYPNREKHGLEYFGQEFGILKPEISDWSNLSIDSYIFRCQEDVKINKKLWERQLYYLKQLYTTQEEIDRYCFYLSFKMDCVREQEEIGIKLDVEHCKNMLETLSAEKVRKIDSLKLAMPKNPIKKKKVYKDAIKDRNGNIYTKGDLFYSFVDSDESPRDIVIETIKGYEEPNPNSHIQIKNWLYSLGWNPSHIKHVRNKVTNETKKIPQISSKFIQGEVCESIKVLFEKEPKLELLNGLSILSHRISIFEGFLEDQKDGRLYPSCSGITNTLRLQHRVIVNLPGFDKRYGKEIRSSLISNSEEILCGSDISALEDSTKQHYIYPYDKKYVEDMRIPGFDPHIDLAILAGLLSKEQADDHKLYEKTNGAEGKSYKSIRFKAKTTNFCSLYGASPEKIAITASISLREAKKLHTIYWERNKSVKKVADSAKTKMVYSQEWIYNPVSRFWYILRNKRDKFSTLNQGLASFVFDTWVKYIRHNGIKIACQYHDEALFNCIEQEKTEKILRDSMKQANEELKLNVQIDCSVAFGSNYFLCH